MNSRTNESCNLKKNVGFALYDGINTKEQTVISLKKDAFEGENMQSQYTVLKTELIFIFINTNLPLKLMNQVKMIEILIMKYKDGENQKEDLIVYLLGLILIQQTLTFLRK